MFEIEKMGKKIAELRKKNNMTQSEFADALNISYQAISNWERGQSMPDISKLKDIANIFNVSIDDLFDNSDNKIIKKVALGEEIKLQTEDEKKDLLKAAPLIKPSDLDKILENAEVSETNINDEIKKEINEMIKSNFEVNEYETNEEALIENIKVNIINNLDDIIKKALSNCSVEKESEKEKEGKGFESKMDLNWDSYSSQDINEEKKGKIKKIVYEVEKLLAKLPKNFNYRINKENNNNNKESLIKENLKKESKEEKTKDFSFDDIVEISEYTNEETVVKLTKKYIDKNAKFNVSYLEDLCRTINEESLMELILHYLNKDKSNTDKSNGKNTYDKINDFEVILLNLSKENKMLIVDSIIENASKLKLSYFEDIFYILSDEEKDLLLDKLFLKEEKVEFDNIEDILFSLNKLQKQRFINKIIEHNVIIPSDTLEVIASQINSKSTLNLLMNVMKKDESFNMESIEDIICYLNREDRKKLVDYIIKGNFEYDLDFVNSIRDYLSEKSIKRLIEELFSIENWEAEWN